jgi:hypothetical protein
MPDESGSLGHRCREAGRVRLRVEAWISPGFSRREGQPIADRLVAEAKAGRVRVYDYGTIRSAEHQASMAGQPRRRPKFGGALNQPARGEYHTTRLAVEHQGKKGRDK